MFSSIELLPVNHYAHNFSSLWTLSHYPEVPTWKVKYYPYDSEGKVALPLHQHRAVVLLQECPIIETKLVYTRIITEGLDETLAVPAAGLMGYRAIWPQTRIPSYQHPCCSTI